MNVRGLEKLPPHMRDAARLYVERGISGGSFLTAVLSNDLMGAFRRADDDNADAMKAWVMWLYNDAPGDCWGSPAHVKDWIKFGGLAGIEAASRAREMNVELPDATRQVLAVKGMI